MELESKGCLSRAFSMHHCDCITVACSADPLHPHSLSLLAPPSPSPSFPASLGPRRKKQADARLSPAIQSCAIEQEKLQASSQVNPVRRGTGQRVQRSHPLHSLDKLNTAGKRWASCADCENSETHQEASRNHRLNQPFATPYCRNDCPATKHHYWGQTFVPLRNIRSRWR